MAETMYKLEPGDIFSVSINAFASKCFVEQVNSSQFRIVEAKKVRLSHVFRVFGRYFRIPHLTKTWVMTIEFCGQKEGADGGNPI